MFLLRRPSPAIIERFLRDSQQRPLSYAPVGLIQAPSPGYDRDEVAVPIGRGRTALERGRAALDAWIQFNTGWVQVFPPQAPVREGTVVAVLIRHLGFWSLNGCRIVRVLYDVGDALPSGFVYGTLTNHAEQGEESFEVFVDSDTGEVMYRLRAASRPRHALTRLGYPIVRMLQARFRRDSVAAMRRAGARPG